MKRNRGFTLMEMLIVVAIIAVLAAIAIPVAGNALHKAKVSADMANVRAHYAELQVEYLTTGEFRPLGDYWIDELSKEITFLDGTTVQLQAGQASFVLHRERDFGKQGDPVEYRAIYLCDKGHDEHILRLQNSKETA